VIHRHKDEFDVGAMCEALEVSRSGYYAWVNRGSSPRQTRRERAVEAIGAIHAESKGTCGSPRVHVELAERKLELNVKTVAKYMRQAGIKAKTPRRFNVRTTDSSHGLPVFQNALDRDFQAEAPNREWLCDIACIPTEEGFICLAAVLDAFSRKIVGWSMSDSLETTICVEASRSAISDRKRLPGGLSSLLHHSDRGCQYASREYQRLLEDHGVGVSMSRVGNCCDNAMMESFWGTLKTELVHHERHATKQAARDSVISWIEGWYDRRRRHSAIGYVSPESFEAKLN
jgi:transposase InsO family protein